ncbi:ImmA/IrrE family metallo-endopeptidase [Porcipelethomonas sp.]|uniref:ImmA/IrrE family metallo-endopeptidase n=1 Tax=Porcipelethomonas sp. TaxID=2981675 RepID=UPI003EFABD98
MECKRIINAFKAGKIERSIDSAIALAEELIKSLKIKKYPVPIVQIVDELGFHVFSAQFPPNISGVIMINPDIKERLGSDRVICVSNMDTTGRQRFTIAHEFAHFLFDFNEKEDAVYYDTYNINKSDKEQESIPSRFAAEFLMPKTIFVKRYKELKEKNVPKYDLIATLTYDFNVSQKAVLKRCEELSDEISWE